MILSLLFSVCVASAYIVERSTFVEHPKEWTAGERADPARLMHLSFAIKNQNLDVLKKALDAVSFPDSPEYGKHWTKEQVDELTCPSQESLSTVEKFLNKNFLSPKIDNSACGYMDIVVPVQLAEQVLETEFFEFSHPRFDSTLVRSKSHYKLAEQLSEHVLFVAGTINLPTIRASIRMEQQDTKKRQFLGGVTPFVYRKRFNIDQAVKPTNGKTIGAFAEFLNQNFDESDLTEFTYLFARDIIGAKVEKVINQNNANAPGVESSLDCQTLLGVSGGARTWVFGDSNLPHANQEPFLEFAKNALTLSELPQVISISYGDVESSMTPAFVHQVDAEMQKLGLRGVSVLIAAGDSGAACNANNSAFAPDFPASCPHVTTVGGLQVEAGGSHVTGEMETWSLGGSGFSNFFQTPSWQLTTVTGWLKSSAPKPPHQFFNSSGRAYPDLAAWSDYVWIVNSLVPMPVGGTSASSPATAAALVLVNDHRFNSNKTPLGWLNPVLYARATSDKLSTQITAGSNVGCASNQGVGFTASSAFPWSPATGWGALDYQTFIKLQ